MALDRVNRRLFIPAYGNGGYRAFQLDENGLPTERSAMYVIGRENIYGRRSAPEVDERELAFPGAIAFFDNSTQRLFGVDRFNNRILVFQVAPDEVEKYPAAQVVIGQPDFQSTTRSIGPNRFGMAAGAAIDEVGQRMWVPDPPNNRILMFDIHPDRLASDPDALLVLGQVDFEARSAGLGADSMAAPMSVAYDPVFDRLFVSDMGNNRVLIFDADPDRMRSGGVAMAVMGQPDFASRQPRRSLDQLKPESLSYDGVNHRLFIAEDLQHRIMVFDAHPDRVGGPATAVAVVGQPDAFTTTPQVSQSRLAMPRLAVDATAQKLYVSEGFPAGNRISIWDIKPGNLKTGMLASDLLGHETAAGDPDFDSRIPQGRLDGRSLAAARAVALDPVDHRLFVADEYNHRVVVWQLDALNRVSDRSARWVLGQPDLRSSYMGPPTASNMTVPLAVAYDPVSKRVFVGDGYQNRVLVYDAAPGTLATGMSASVVVGQEDFESVAFGAGRDRLNFGVRMGRGIASNFLPMGLAVDSDGQRLFLSDGENHRVLMFDISHDSFRNGASALAVLGQPDFDSTDVGGGRRGVHDPGHLAYDPDGGRLFVIDAKNTRVLVFDVRPDALKNGAAAIGVLGHSGFETEMAARPPSGLMSGTSRRSRSDVADDTFFAPNGIAYDRRHKLLYVSDAVVPADRILVFNVDPDVFDDGATAATVLGESEESAGAPGVFGGQKGYPGQFTVRDSRGIALDEANGRLFVTGSFESRVVIFHFPRARWQYRVAGQGLQRFHTPDAVDLGIKAEPRTSRTASLLASDGAPTGVALYSVTDMFVDERTQRHTRMLVSEAALAASAPVTDATIFVDGAEGRDHVVRLYNPGDAVSRTSFVLHDESGVAVATWDREVGAGAQVEVVVEQTSGTQVAPQSTLVVDSSSPVVVAALRRTTNGRGEVLLAPAPTATGASRTERTILPLVRSGGGQQTDIIVTNDSDGAAHGTISIRNAEGARDPLGLDSVLIPYVIPPNATRVVSTTVIGPRVLNGYAFLTPEDGVVPFLAALIRRRSGDVWTSESLVSARESRTARFAVNAEPTLIRHGTIESEFVVSNAGSSAARVEFGLEGAARVERSLAAGRQLTITLSELFGERASGIVRIESDEPVGVTARQLTTNFRAETIAVELPDLETVSGRLFSWVPNGAGLSTEVRLAHLGPGTMEGHLEFRTADGTLDRETILR